MENQDGKEDDFVFKIILVGDQGVGKSSILLRYTQNEFRRDYNVTIGVEFASKLVEIDSETNVNLQIWDTAGQESFRAIVRSFYRNATAVFLVYQINRKDTFKSLQGWLDEIRENSNQNIIIVLMGNQSDRVGEREVSFEEGEAFMKENRLHFFFETSALDGSKVDTAFQAASRLIFVNYIGALAKSAANPLDVANSKPMRLTPDGNTQGNTAKKSACCQ